MIEYKCNECRMVSTETEWNEATRKGLGSFTPLGDCTDVYSLSYVCPKCKERNDAYMMDKQ